MSHNDSTMPATEGALAPNKVGGRLRRRLRKPLIVGVAVTLMSTLAACGDEDASANCVTDEILLTAAPAMKDLVDTAAKAVAAEQECMEFKVSEGTVKDVIALLNDPDATMPELWIPDSPTWQGQLSAAGWSGTAIADSIAQTPVGLASGPSARPPASWTEVLTSGRLSMGDPSADGASALALLAPYAEMKKTGNTQQAVQELIVPVAQSFGERNIEGGATGNDLTAIGATSTQFVPVTEQGYLTARRSNDQLTLVAPQTGVAMLEYPIIRVSKGGGGLLSGGTREDLSSRAGRAMSHWFSSNEGQAAVVEAEFQVPGAESSEGTGLSTAKRLPEVGQTTTDEALRNWRVVSVPSSMLVVFDLSLSMRRDMGGASRYETAAGASATALDVLPDLARIGLWGFSKNRVDGKAWEEFVPMRTLSEQVGDTTQREVLRAQTASLRSELAFGTGLYDTLVDAYRAALENWDQAYFNSVVVFTDGAHDDTSEISLEGLIKQIEGMRDPAKPIKVVIVGMSEESESSELTQVANLTGGLPFIVRRPEDILGVLSQALMNR